MNKYWEEIIKLAKKAADQNEVPVGAIIVYDDKIIVKGYNKREQKNNVLAHAEIECINKANAKFKNWKLTECDLYVSMKPCSMCEAVIKQSRLRNVYYLVDKPEFKKEYNKTNVCKINNSEFSKEYQEILSKFFNKLR